MRAKNDAILGLQKYITEWGVADEAELKAIDKNAKAEVEAAVAEAKESPFPDLKEFWTDIYVSIEIRVNSVSLMSSTRELSHPSCEDERRRRFTITSRPANDCGLRSDRVVF